MTCIDKDPRMVMVDISHLLLKTLLFVTLLDSTKTTWTPCTAIPNAPPKPGDPPLPSLPRSFRTRIEANILNKGYTTSAVEYVDAENNRAVLKMWKNAVETDVFFDFPNNQLFSIVGSRCTVSNLTGDFNTVLLGGVDVVDGIPHVHTTAGVLRFAKELGETYMGSGTLVRGLKANHWQTCMYWPVVRANFTLDYYFTAPGWSNPAGIASVPLRAEVTGITTTASGVSQEFHHIYDFIDFSTEMPYDSSVYETPAGISCPGRKRVRELPTLSKTFYFREEIISPGIKSIQQTDIWYDSDRKLVRFDSRLLGMVPSFINKKPSTEIHDFNTGVAYVIDKIMKNCSIMPIPNGTFDSVHDGSGTYIKLRSPRYLFYLDDTYAYSGKRKARGIDCDVFTSTRMDVEGGQTVYEIYFLSEDWLSIDDTGLAESAADIPVRLLLTDLNDGFGYEHIYEIYNFDPEAPDIQTAFDISNCFNDSEQKDFWITFPSRDGYLLSKYRSNFIDQTIALISSLTEGLSPLRITNTEVHWDDSNVYFLGTLLEKAPPIAKYRKIPGKIPLFDNTQTLQGVTDPYSCAEQCDSVDTFTCNSFDICAGKQMCTLSKDYNSDGVKLSDSLECDHYTRVLGGKIDKEVSLNDVWNMLEEQITKKSFQIKFNGDKAAIYVASDISVDAFSNSDKQSSSTQRPTCLTVPVNPTTKQIKTTAAPRQSTSTGTPAPKDTTVKATTTVTPAPTSPTVPATTTTVTSIPSTPTDPATTTATPAPTSTIVPATTTTVTSIPSNSTAPATTTTVTPLFTSPTVLKTTAAVTPAPTSVNAPATLTRKPIKTATTPQQPKNTNTQYARGSTSADQSEVTSAPQQSNETGTIVGVAFAMLIIGVISGMGGLHLCRKYRLFRFSDIELQRLR